MARQRHKISALTIERAKAGRLDPGKYRHGGGLILKVTPARTASWVYRFGQDGTQRDVGLGSVRDVGLQHARELVHEHAKARASGGIVPTAKERAREAAKLSAAVRGVPTF